MDNYNKVACCLPNQYLHNIFLKLNNAYKQLHLVKYEDGNIKIELYRKTKLCAQYVLL